MGKVVTSASVSLDGYIAGPEESGFEHLFAWYDGGTTEFPSRHPDVQFNLSEEDHAYLTEFIDDVGVLVVGRHLFDMTNGWDGTHPLDRPVVVVTHNVPEEWVEAHADAPFTFVTDGVAAALERAQKIAGGKDVVVNGGTMATQCLELGRLDEITLDIVPVILGGGVRYVDVAEAAPILLDGPTITQGSRVTHLHYVVRKP